MFRSPQFEAMHPLVRAALAAATRDVVEITETRDGDGRLVSIKSKRRSPTNVAAALKSLLSIVRHLIQAEQDARAARQAHDLLWELASCARSPDRRQPPQRQTAGAESLADSHPTHLAEVEPERLTAKPGPASGSKK